MANLEVLLTKVKTQDALTEAIAELNDGRFIYGQAKEKIITIIRLIDDLEKIEKTLDRA